MMKNHTLSGLVIWLWLLLLCSVQIQGQEALLPGKFFKGYSGSVKGGGFQYHSPLPDVGSSLLLRSIDSVQFIEWETAVIPSDYEGNTVSLVWMFGIDANIDSHQFRLYLNDQHCVTFSNPLTSEDKPWKVSGASGETLLFRPVMIDKYGDPMGYAVLTVPVSKVKKGISQKIRITGESKESRSWYMTFEAGVEESVTIRQVPALVKHHGGLAVPVYFQFVHLGEPAQGVAEIAGIPPTSFRIETGFTEVKVLIPGKDAGRTFTANIKIEGQPDLTRQFTVSEVPQLTIYLVQHTHTDIGYTRPQTEILPDHLRYIDYALDFCDQTDSLPEDARFRWTCETTWAVREYLRSRPESQVERLRKRAQEGRIEIAGLFLNSSDLADEAMIVNTLDPVREIREAGIPVKAAMQSDINGVPWCLTDYLPVAGIGYLNMAQNTHRAMKPFSIPTPFWWESPSGNRLLVNRPEHYMLGNSLGILSPAETFATSLFRHLEDIRKKGYRYNRYAIQFSGYQTDNSPPSTSACNLVAEWNNTYAWPKLRLATISEFIDYVKSAHGNELPVVRGAWPDWWMDGFGSAAIQTAYARMAHSDYIANEGLMAMAAAMGAAPGSYLAGLRKEIRDDIAFYDEHTFGAAESITDPLAENSVVQLGQKESYVWSAVKKNRLLREMVMGNIQPLLPGDQHATLTLFNTLGWTRKSTAMVYIDHQLLPKDRKFKLTDLPGNTIAMQPVSTREEGTWWMVRPPELWPMGYQTFRIEVEEQPREVPGESPFTGIFENDYYRLEFSPSTGQILRLTDKKWNKELIDPAAPHSMGEVIYERLGKNRGQLEQFRLDEFTRTSWKNLKFSPIMDGSIFRSLMIQGELPGCTSEPVRCEIRLYHDLRKIEFLYSMKKLPVTDPEGLYVAFPFMLEDANLVLQVAGGTFVPGKEQVENSSSDWAGIQDFAALRNHSGQIVFVSPEIPLVQPGDINTGKFIKTGINGLGISKGSENYPASGSIYSWVLNNYWTTNFLASQDGELKWSYHITSGPDPSNATATRFGMDSRVPVLNRVMPPAKQSNEPMIPKLYVGNCPPNICLVLAKTSDDGKSITYQLRETDGKTDSIPVYNPLLSSIPLADAVMASAASETDATGREIRRLWSMSDITVGVISQSKVVFKPYEVKFIRLDLGRHNMKY